MRTLYYIFLFLCIATTVAVRADGTNALVWGPKAGNLQMSVRLKEGGNEIKTNQPIELLVRVRNLSTNEGAHFTLWVGAEIFASGSSSPILSVSGKDSHFFQLKDGSIGGSMGMCFAPPDGDYEYEFNIGCLKEPKANSVYKIVTKRMVRACFKNEIVLNMCKLLMLYNIRSVS